MNNKERSSNIELLKIIAMFIICASHVINPFVYSGDAAFSSNPLFLFYNFVKSIGWLGDYIFIGCTVYFLLDITKINFRKIIFYYIDVSIILIAHYLVYFLLGIKGTENYTAAVFTTTMITKFWYVPVYLGFLVIAPFINPLIKKLPKKLHLLLIVVSIGLIEITHQLHEREYLSFAITPLFYLSMDLIIAYGKAYGRYLFYKYDDKKSALIGFLITFFVFIAKIYIGNLLGLKGVIQKVVNLKETLYMDSIIFVFLSIPLIVYFQNLNIAQNKTINYLSSLSLIFYISHQNAFTGLVWDQPTYEICLRNEKFTILLIICFCIARFIYGLLVSSLFKETTHKLLYKLIMKKKDKRILQPSSN